MDVLLVEDELAVRELLQDDLADAGLDVVPAPNAEVGLEVAANDNQPPAVLVTDVDLGSGMDGVALAREAQRRWPAVAVVVMTGDERNLGRLPDGLRASCLVKPFSPQRLANTVNSLLGRPAALRTCGGRAQS
jgi:DNA-binding response OmpR family regulator